MHIVRRLLFSVGVLLAALAVSAFTEPPRNFPDLPADIHPILVALAEGLGTSLAYATRYPLYIVAVAMVALFPFVVAEIVSWMPRRIDKDPQRLFTAQQKQSGGHRAGGRCEMENIFFARCRRLGEHGDHWYPHSKGGASDMDNYVHACARHNLAKGGRVPTFWETQRLEWRRRRYFPAGEVLARPGSKFRAW